MSLVSSDLQTSLSLLFSGQFVFPGETLGRWPKTYIEAAKAWTKCYSDYASAAQSCQGLGPVPVNFSAAIALLETSMAVTFNTVDPATCAASLAASLSSFWLTPPMIFLGATVGTVTAVSGTFALQSSLISNWASNILAHISSADAAVQHAAMFDAFTKTVVVTHIAPGACASVLT